jgi:hypothetical protein
MICPWCWVSCSRRSRSSPSRVSVHFTPSMVSTSAAPERGLQHALLAGHVVTRQGAAEADPTIVLDRLGVALACPDHTPHLGADRVRPVAQTLTQVRLRECFDHLVMGECGRVETFDDLGSHRATRSHRAPGRRRSRGARDGPPRGCGEVFGAVGQSARSTCLAEVRRQGHRGTVQADWRCSLRG